MKLRGFRETFLGLAVCAVLLFCVSCATQRGPREVRLPRKVSEYGFVVSSEEWYFAELTCDGDTIQVKGSADKPQKVPVGTYSLSKCNILRTDSDGVIWQISGLARGVEVATVTANETTSLAFGPPLKAELIVSKARGALILDVFIKGRAGEVYSMALIKRGRDNIPAPGVEIRNASGKVIAQGRFEYG